MAKKKANYKGHAKPYAGEVGNNGVKHKTVDKASKSRTPKGA